MLANGDNVPANGVRERRSKNLLIRCKLQASAYSTVGLACGLLKRPCNCNGVTKNVKFILTTTVHMQCKICSIVAHFALSIDCSARTIDLSFAPIYRSRTTDGSRNNRSIVQQVACTINRTHVNSNALAQSIDSARVRIGAKAWCLDCFAFQGAVSCTCIIDDMDPLFKAWMTRVANSNTASKKSCILTKAMFDAIVNHLLHPADKVDHHFKHWVKTRKLPVVDLPLSQVLVIPNDESVKVWCSTYVHNECIPLL